MADIDCMRYDDIRRSLIKTKEILSILATEVCDEKLVKAYMSVSDVITVLETYNNRINLIIDETTGRPFGYYSSFI